MTQDEIIHMAREAGFTDYYPERLTRFAALVAAHEREKFYGKDKPEECANGCPKNQVCDYCQRAEQAEQEPVAWHEPGAYSNVTVYKNWANENGWIPLYTRPVRTKDLTYAELGELFVKAKEETFGYARVKPEGGISLKPSIEYFARAVIAADREKNK